MTEHQYIAETERAQLARQIVENPLWIAAWTDFGNTLIAEWMASNTGDQDGREALYLMFQAARHARKVLEKHIETGKLAEMSLEELKKGKAA